MNIDEARQACKNGAVAAFISGTLTTIVVAVALLGDSDGNLTLWNDPTNFVDIALIFGCGVGMLKYSRTAAVSIFLYFVISKTAIALETGQTTGLLITLAFLFYFGKAVLGSYAYKKAMKADNPEFRSAPRLESRRRRPMPWLRSVRPGLRTADAESRSSSPPAVPKTCPGACSGFLI